MRECGLRTACGQATRTGAYGVLVDDEERPLALWNEGAKPLDASRRRVEHAETPEQAAVREVREETGYDGVVACRRGPFTVPAGKRLDGVLGRSSVRLVFEARIIGGELTRTTARPTRPHGSRSRGRRARASARDIALSTFSGDHGARGRAATTSGVAATRRASAERLSGSRTRFRSARRARSGRGQDDRPRATTRGGARRRPSER